MLVQLGGHVVHDASEGQVVVEEVAVLYLRLAVPSAFLIQLEEVGQQLYGLKEIFDLRF